MARTDIQMNIRIPETLKTMLERAAEMSSRSVSAELIYRLEASFPENVTHHLIKRRQEELGMIQTLLEHNAWLQSMAEDAGDHGAMTRARMEVSHLRRQERSLVNDIEGLQQALNLPDSDP